MNRRPVGARTMRAFLLRLTADLQELAEEMSDLRRAGAEWSPVLGEQDPGEEAREGLVAALVPVIGAALNDLTGGDIDNRTVRALLLDLRDRSGTITRAARGKVLPGTRRLGRLVRRGLGTVG